MEDVTKLLEKCSRDMNEVKTQKNNIVQEVNALREAIYGLETQVAANSLELKKENDQLKTQTQSMERRLKKYNLVICGLEEGETDLYEVVFSSIYKDRS
ncbi:hypothetical protein JTB14_024407 [Gonioctena quinquepunctata]|nr:hypothetical protein JTB14_024407 [Gonioctena quinquepunctata]